MSFWEPWWITVIYMDLGDKYDDIASECDIMSSNTYDGLKFMKLTRFVFVIM